MTFKACVLGAVFGFLMAIGSSCSAAKCGPANCGGCCDANNTCIARSASDTDALCGTQGNACVDCTAQGKTCDATTSACKASNTGGGTGTGGGSGTGGGGSHTGGGTGTGGGGGQDAGLMSNCNINTQNCNTGEACMYATGTTAITRCSPGGCDLVDTGTCSSSEKCSFATQLADGGYGRGCVPLAGSLAEGANCASDAGLDACGPGLTCLVNDAESVCAKACYKQGDCGTGHCSVLIGTFNPNEYMTYCLRGCDIFKQDCGNTVEGCYQFNASSNVCLPSSGTAVGASCMSATACVPGAVCVSSSATEAACRQVCNLDAGAPTCTAGSCIAYQGSNFGVCH